MLIAAAIISTTAFNRETATDGSVTTFKNMQTTKRIRWCKSKRGQKLVSYCSDWKIVFWNSSRRRLNFGIHRIGLGVRPLARRGLGLGVRRPTPLLMARSCDPFLRIGDGSRAEPFPPAGLGLAAIRVGCCDAVRRRIFEACSSLVIHVLGLRSMAMAPCALTFVTVAGNHSLCDEEWYSTRSPT